MALWIRTKTPGRTHVLEASRFIRPVEAVGEGLGPARAAQGVLADVTGGFVDTVGLPGPVPSAPSGDGEGEGSSAHTGLSGGPETQRGLRHSTPAAASLVLRKQSLPSWSPGGGAERSPGESVTHAPVPGSVPGTAEDRLAHPHPHPPCVPAPTPCLFRSQEAVSSLQLKPREQPPLPASAT